MPTKALYFSGDVKQTLVELERLRKLQAYCGHDLRSQLGAVLGLLQIMSEDPKLGFLKANANFQFAIKSACEALEDLDHHVLQARPEFRVAWLFIAGEPAGKPQDGVKPDDCSMEPRLFVRLGSEVELVEKLRSYRPAYLFLSGELQPDNLSAIVRRVGPQLVKIFICGNSEMQRPTGVKLLSSATPSWSEIHAAIDESEHGMKKTLSVGC